MAAARDLVGDDYHVVAVIGDGALTGGLAYEGLNNAGDLAKNLLVILNDNDFSISPNVGGISRYLTRITSGPLYRQVEADVWDLLGHVPGVGAKARQAAKRLKESLKTLVVPNLFFEELGFKYFGPVDGHDVKELVTLLRHAARRSRGRCSCTCARSRARATRPPSRTRASSTASASSTRSPGTAEASTKSTYTQVFAQAAIDEAERDPRVVAITAAMPDNTGLSAFQAKFPDRFFDVGMAEQHAVTLRRRARHRGRGADRRDLLDVPAARLRPDRARRHAAEAARRARGRPRGPRGRGRLDPPRRLRHRATCARCPGSC